MRELSIDEMHVVSGGDDGSIRLSTISIESGRSDGAGGGRAGYEAKFGKQIDVGTYQRGDVITRINRDANGKVTYQVYNKKTSIYVGSDERTLLQKLTAEFGFRIGGANSRANEPR